MSNNISPLIFNSVNYIDKKKYPLTAYLSLWYTTHAQQTVNLLSIFFNCEHETFTKQGQLHIPPLTQSCTPWTSTMKTTSDRRVRVCYRGLTNGGHGGLGGLRVAQRIRKPSGGPPCLAVWIQSMWVLFVSSFAIRAHPCIYWLDPTNAHKPTRTCTHVTIRSQIS